MREEHGCWSTSLIYKVRSLRDHGPHSLVDWRRAESTSVPQIFQGRSGTTSPQVLRRTIICTTAGLQLLQTPFRPKPVSTSRLELGLAAELTDSLQRWIGSG